MSHNILDLDATDSTIPYEKRSVRRKKFNDGKLYMLVVDDNEEVLETHIGNLEPYGKVDSALDGDIALNKIVKAYQSRKPYDIVFLDIGMEKMNGDEVLKKICGLQGFEKLMGIDRLSGTMFVMVTGNDSFAAVTDAMKYPNVHYIVKGVKNIKDEMINIIQNAI